jgi:hypothetical protein
MSKQLTMTGARAIVRVDGVTVGVFDSAQYGANLGTEPIHTLGRYSASEISITSYEAVQVSCSGFRVVGQGVHTLPKAPKIKDLLSFERVQLQIVDRKDGTTIMTVTDCVPANWSESQNAKATSKLNITYIGTRLFDESSPDGDDESGDQSPAVAATNLEPS